MSALVAVFCMLQIFQATEVGFVSQERLVKGYLLLMVALFLCRKSLIIICFQDKL